MEDKIDLRKLFGTLWRGKIWIAILGLIFLAAGIWYAFVLAVPIYSASAKVALETREQNLMDIESVVASLGGDQSSVNTEVEIIKSRILAERLVNDLGLIEDPEFNVELRELPVFSAEMAVSFVREVILGPLPPKPNPTDQEVLDATIDSVLSIIGVSNVRNSLVFTIRATTESPAKSAAIANRLAEIYIEDQVQVKFEKTEQASIWLTERVTELQITLEGAENALKAFSSNTDLVSPESLVALNRQLKEFRDRQQSLEEQITAQAKRIESLRPALQAGDFELFSTLANDRSLALLLQTMRGTEAERNQLFITQAQIVLDKKILDLERAQSQLSAVTQSIEEENARIDTQSDELVRLQQLQREAEASRLIYEAFLTRLKEISVQQGTQQADARILSRAVVLQTPVAPRKSVIIALSLMLGTMLGAALVLLREFSQNTFRTAEDLEALTKATVLAQIPIVPAQRRAKIIKYLNDKPNSGAAESIRNLRTSLMLANVDNDPQLIMCTSSIPSEGKTTQSIALALNFAQMGDKVLLLEGDIRRRVFESYFNVATNKASFLSVLSGKVLLEEAIHKAEGQKFDILMGESASVNAADLFSSEKFETMLKDLRKIYDRIIIDTPPVLAVPDARVIGQQVDAIIYVVKWDSTSQRQVLDGLKLLETVNLKVSGLVLGQINKRGMRRYGYGDSYGSYQGYYND